MSFPAAKPAPCQMLAARQFSMIDRRTSAENRTSPGNPGYEARSGLSLVEVLIAMTMTLVVLGVMIQVFGRASNEMARKRAMIDMHNQLRVCSDLMRGDLQQLMVPPRPWAMESSPNGHFEYVEGPLHDSSTYGTAEAIRGDLDDMLSMTIRSKGNPFRGRWVDATGVTQIIESNLAEVIWWTDFNDRNGNGALDYDETVTVYRRQQLIRPDLGINLYVVAGTPLTPASLLLQNDVSMSFASGTPFANSSEELAKRENRFGHNQAALPVPTPPTAPPLAPVAATPAPGFPYRIDRAFLRSVRLTPENLSALDPTNPFLPQFAGNDIVANDVAAFDIQIFSPDAVVSQFNPGILNDPVNSPADPEVVCSSNSGFYAGFAGPPGTLTQVGSGAFVDLAYLARLRILDATSPTGFDYEYSGSFHNLLGTSAPTAQFSTWSSPKSQLTYFYNPLLPALGFDVAYDTFSNHYEFNGLDEDNDGVTDQKTDGLDQYGVTGVDDDNDNGVDDSNESGGVDDVLERETEPPYPFDVRGIKVVFRVIDRVSAQAHQDSVIESYVKK